MYTGISTLSDSRLDEFLASGAKAYPDRDHKRRFELYVKSNPLAAEGGRAEVLLATLNDRLIGHFIVSPFRYHFRGRQSQGFWGWDYYMDPAHRQSGLGGLLGVRAIRGYRPYFASAPRAEALGIHLSLQTRIIGNLRKFLWLRGWPGAFAASRATLQQARLWPKAPQTPPEAPFPPALDSANGRWTRRNEPWPWRQRPWRDGVLEADRNEAFLAWRFFQEPQKYAIYLSGQTYFSVRRRFWKGLDLLMLMDHRGPFEDSAGFTSVLSACKDLARRLRLHGVLALGSHRAIDGALRRARFIRVGRDWPVLSNAKLGELTPESRETLFMTFADSDIGL